MARKLFIIIAVAFISTANLLAQEVNYDESRVAPYTLPDPLRFADGRRVKKNTWPQRRKEILGIFQSEMYGQMPPPSPIYLEQLEEGTTLAGFGHRRQVRMWFREDKTGPFVDWLIITPTSTRKQVPAVMLLNYRGNHTILTDEEIIITDTRDVPLNLYREEAPRGLCANPDTVSYYPVSSILARGYAFVTACYNDVSADPNPSSLEEQNRYAYNRVFELWGPRDNTRIDNTTCLAAWAWALSRGMDMLERDSAIDASRVVLTGSSRLGKAALIAGAFDERFPVVVPNQTGGGGVPLAKRNYGENITTETRAFTHWYCRAYDKYAGHEDQMLFDQHMLLACIAPRALLVEGFDEPWFDTRGEFLSLQAASPVWKMLTGKGLPNVEWPADYDTSAIGERLGYVRRNLQHGHSAIDWKWMLDFADKVFEGK
ncbi:MAG: hypothetical protein IJ624_08050 [Prevotella sp.]|nr:hypothetical protein [Prevotella sp.]